jgi:hypothetical protein
MALCVVPLSVIGTASARRDDLAALDEGARDGDRLIEQPARIVAQVDDEADQLVAGLLLQVLDRVLEPGVSLLVEAGDADVADIVPLEMRLDRLDLDDGPGEDDVERVAALAANRQLDPGRAEPSSLHARELRNMQAIHGTKQLSLMGQPGKPRPGNPPRDHPDPDKPAPVEEPPRPIQPPKPDYPPPPMQA